LDDTEEPCRRRPGSRIALAKEGSRGLRAQSAGRPQRASPGTVRAVSEENVELLLRGYETWNRRDLEAALEFLDPEIEWRFSDKEVALPDGALVYHGHDGVRQFWAQFMEPLPEIQIDVERTLDGNDYVVAFIRSRATAINQPSVHVWTFRDGKVVTFTAYNDPDRALEAVGLSK
jgi:ketosteroid isomerase-like protein